MGIGVELAIDQSGYAKVIKVYDESPAKEAGSSGAITSPPSTAQTSKVWAAWRLSRTNSGARAARASM